MEIAATSHAFVKIYLSPAPRGNSTYRVQKVQHFHARAISISHTKILRQRWMRGTEHTNEAPVARVDKQGPVLQVDEERILP